MDYIYSPPMLYTAKGPFEISLVSTVLASQPSPFLPTHNLKHYYFKRHLNPYQTQNLRFFDLLSYRLFIPQLCRFFIPYSPAYIFTLNWVVDTLGRIIFIHLLRVTLLRGLSKSPQLARYYHHRLYRFYPLILYNITIIDGKNFTSALLHYVQRSSLGFSGSQEISSMNSYKSPCRSDYIFTRFYSSCLPFRISIAYTLLYSLLPNKKVCFRQSLRF